MSTKNRKYLYQKAKYEQLSNRQRQDNYNLRFSVIEKKKTYDALEDPHASYYFFSQSVKNHLKNIKNAALNETTHSVEKKRLKKLFQEKIKFKPKNLFINHPQFQDRGSLLTTEVFRKSSLQTVHSQRYKSPRKQSERETKMSINSMDRYHSLSKRHFNKTQSNRKENQEVKYDQNSPQAEINQQFQIQDQAQVIKFTKMKNYDLDKLQAKRKQAQNRKKKHEQLHEKRHRTFLNFIEEKKKLVKDFQESLSIKVQ